RFRAAAGAEGLDRVPGELPQQRLRDLRAGAVTGTEKQHPWHADALPRTCGLDGRRREPQRGVERGPGLGEQFAEGTEAEAVVGVALIGRAPPRRHHLGGPQPAQVLGDETLRLAESADQFADTTVAPCELAQEPPAQRMAGQLKQNRWRLSR